MSSCGYASAAKTTLVGEVRFINGTGLDVEAYQQGDTMYMRVVASGGATGGYFGCFLYEPGASYATTGKTWWSTSVDDTVTYVLKLDDPLGEWTVVLENAYETRTGWKEKTLDTDNVNVLAGVPSNSPPDAAIDLITPNPVIRGNAADFLGTATDPDGDPIAIHEWHYWSSVGGVRQDFLGVFSVAEDVIDKVIDWPVGEYIIEFYAYDGQDYSESGGPVVFDVGLGGVTELLREGGQYIFNGATDGWPNYDYTAEGGEVAARAYIDQREAQAFALACGLATDSLSPVAGVWVTVTTPETTVYEALVAGHIKGRVDLQGFGEATITYDVRVIEDSGGSVVSQAMILCLDDPPESVDADFGKMVTWSATEGRTYRIGVFVQAYAMASTILMPPDFIPTPSTVWADAHDDYPAILPTEGGISFDWISAGADPDVIMSDGFTTGNLPGWDLTETGGIVAVGEVNIPGSAGYVMALLRDEVATGGVSASYELYTPQTTHLVAEAKMAVSTEADWHWGYFMLRDTAGAPAVHVTFKDGQIKYYDGGWKDLDTDVYYDPSVWYRISVDVDIVNQVYDIYVDDELVKEGAQFYGYHSSIADVYFQAGYFNTASPIGVFVDYVTVEV